MSSTSENKIIETNFDWIFNRLPDRILQTKLNFGQLFIVSEDRRAYVYGESDEDGQNFIKTSFFHQIHLVDSPRHSVRGEFLEAFLFIEFMVFMLCYCSVGLFKSDYSNKSVNLSIKFIKKASLRSQLTILKQEKIVPAAFNKKVEKLIDFRNKLAHELEFDSHVNHRIKQYNYEEISSIYNDVLQQLADFYFKNQSMYVSHIDYLVKKNKPKNLNNIEKLAWQEYSEQ